MSFRLKLFVSLFIGQLFFGAATAVFGFDVMRKLAGLFIVEHGTENATLLASTLAEPMLFLDLSRIDAALAGLVADPSVLQALAYDHQGRLVSWAGGADGPTQTVALAQLGDLPRTIIAGDSRQHFVTIRTDGRDVGVLQLSLVRTDLLALAANLGLLPLLPLLLAPAVAFLLSWGLAATLTRRLSHLREAADRIGQGDLTTRARLAGRDEIGVLARSFNRMAARLQEDQSVLEQRMRTDYLTGIPNRFATEETLENLLERVDRIPFHILHIDLDKFKQANDTYGHQCGDAVLREIARRLKAAILPAQGCADPLRCGFVGRIGGDEFIAILVGQDDAQALECANDLIMRINEPVRYGQQAVHVGASIGIATAAPDDAALQATTLLALADIAMYEAKAKSGNGTVLLDEVLRERGRAERAMIAEISRGLDAGEFVPYLQPQLDLRTGGIAGFEVLARWRHPDKGIRTPAEFLLCLRDRDMRNMLDQAIRRAAMSWFARVRKTHPKLAHARIGINVGQHQMAEARLLPKLDALLRHTGLPAKAVAIEILENTLIDERNQQLHSNLQALTKAGFALELDDFGTGYSSMSNLFEFSVSRIKIDRSFVAGIDTDKKRKLIVAAIVGIGHAFGAEVLAEGVESPAELATLRILGCDLVQGYVLAPPMDLDTLERWLAASDSGNAPIVWASAAS